MRRAVHQWASIANPRSPWQRQSPSSAFWVGVDAGVGLLVSGGVFTGTRCRSLRLRSRRRHGMPRAAAR